MKFWVIVILALLGLWLVSSAQLDNPPKEPPGAVLIPDAQRGVPYDQPAPPPKAQPKAPEQVLSFGGYPCGGDCSTHQAGFRWAEEQGITDPDNCTGSTAAFAEGCRVYAAQRSAGDWNR